MPVLQWLHNLSVSRTVRESLWVFPALECIHLYSMVFLITIVAAFDMRLMGVKIARKSQPLSRLAKLVLLLASMCFTVNFLTGMFLFASKAPDYYVNTAFRVKILLIVFGVAYHLVLFSKASKWEDAHAMSIGNKLVGLFSLIIWLGVIAASRWIAFL